jgi:hypothetical protein
MFCRKAKKTRATSFARPAHIAYVPYETGCKADVDQASGENATACLPSRLSRVRAPSPALFSKPPPSRPLRGCFRRSEQQKCRSKAVLLCPKKGSTDTCLHFLASTCLALHLLTKVFATSHRQVVRHWNCCWSNYKAYLEKKQGRQVFLCGYAGNFRKNWLLNTCTDVAPVGE